MNTAQFWLKAQREQSDWLEDVLAGLLINGVAQDDIEVLYFTHEPGRCVVRVCGVPKYEHRISFRSTDSRRSP